MAIKERLVTFQGEYPRLVKGGTVSLSPSKRVPSYQDQT